MDHREKDGSWPREMDLDFMKAAQNLGRKLDVTLIERLAGALLAEKLLDEARIREIVEYKP